MVIVPFVTSYVSVTLQTNQYTERIKFEPVHFMQNVCTYTLMQLVLACLAVLDIHLIIQDPIMYLRQIFAHLKGAIMRPVYFVCDHWILPYSTDPKAIAYSKSTWDSTSGFTLPPEWGSHRKDVIDFAIEHRGLLQEPATLISRKSD